MSDNSWYENGELPPEGIECEVFTNPLWVKCLIKTHMTESGQVIAFYQMANRWGFDSDSSKFRPIKTERELFVDQLYIEWQEIRQPHLKAVFGALYDAGYRKNES